MRILLALLLLVLVACAPTVQEEPPVQQCSWPEIPSNGGCCRDLNENNLCDTTEFAEEIEQQKQQEYEEAAQKARETAKQSGQFKRTVMDDIYDQAKQVASYRFIYKGDVVEVSPDSITLSLVQDKNLGVQTIDGRRQEAIVNKIYLFPLEKRATGYCIPAEEFVKSDTPSPCDALLDKEFEVSYDEFKLKLPTDWLALVEHRNPYDTLPNQHVGRKKTTLYRVRIGDEKLNLWIDDLTSLPIAAERWKADTMIDSDDYIDLQKI